MKEEAERGTEQNPIFHEGVLCGYYIEERDRRRDLTKKYREAEAARAVTAHNLEVCLERVQALEVAIRSAISVSYTGNSAKICTDLSGVLASRPSWVSE